MRLLGNDLNLVELKLDGGLAAKHGNDHADLVFVDLDVLDGAGKGGQRAIQDPNGVANGIVDDDLLLLHAHGVDFVITVYADRSFTFITKTPPTPLLVMKAIGLEKGSGVPNKTKVGTITKAQIAEIAKIKMPDLNVNSLEAAESQVRGTCRSMGITVVD